MKYLVLRNRIKMNKLTKLLNFFSKIGEHTLLYGETNTYKTYITAQFVRYLVEERKYDPMSISVLDFAPELRNIKEMKIGGKISDYYDQVNGCNVIGFHGEIIPSRLNADNKKELMQYICENYRKTMDSIQQFNSKPTEFLIINDISIHLHFGNYKDILEIIDKTDTFFGNTYYGSSISRGKNFTSLLNLKEKKFVEKLISKIQQSFNMNEFTNIFKNKIS